MRACDSPTAGSRMWSRPLSAARVNKGEEVARVRLRPLTPATQHSVVYTQQPGQPPRG